MGQAGQMSVTLCVLLWAQPGQSDALVAYEDTVLQLLPAHGASVLQRVRSIDAPDGPDEVHVLRFPSEEALESYLADPRRAALAAQRDAAISRTQLLRVAVA